MPAITFFILAKAAQRIDFADEQAQLTASAFPHMEENDRERIIRHYERLQDFLFDTTPDNENELAKLKQLQDG